MYVYIYLKKTVHQLSQRLSLSLSLSHTHTHTHTLLLSLSLPPSLIPRTTQTFNMSAHCTSRRVADQTSLTYVAIAATAT